MSTSAGRRGRPRCVAILAAGGQGRRLGGGRPKQYLDLAGASVLERSLRTFARHPRIGAVIVALPPADVADPPGFVRGLGADVRVVAGGARRQDSVALAVAAAPADTEVFVIHDAARPLVDEATIDRTIDAAVRWGAAIAALPARDTVKLAEATPDEGDGARGGPPVIAATIDRDRVWLAQTPQAFTRAVLEDALAKGRAGAAGTDEAALAELAGHRVRLVEGDASNIKITTADDLAVARRLLGSDDAGVSRHGFRIGTGYDSHRFVEGRPLVLGGITIPHHAGLQGHSDADALCHALTDAVLGAAALGDIGRHFPDTDPRWTDADSVELLRGAVELARASGLRIVNVDAVIVAERPRLSPYVDRMRARLAPVLGVPASAVGIKGKTNEGMGETGRGEGLVVHAVALLTTG
jgi:2-C-methyl-D-erythritol 4-phosphate cytidylyltransferase / 2-C-methyl-D-erythritol 2,4-cyclodiphosphate synthase